MKIKKEIDPMKATIIEHGLNLITEEMAIAMKRSARSPLFSEAGDFSCSLFDWKARIIAQLGGVPCHQAGASFAIKYVIDFFHDEIYPGDIVVHNDPYTGGNHLPDWTISSPLFYNEELLGWAANRGHQLDSGGMVGGSYSPEATEIFAEGIIIPPLKLFEKGKLRKDVLNLLIRNVRTQSIMRADLLSMTGAVNVGLKRLLEIINKYGVSDFKLICEHLIKSSETRMKAEIDKIPDGEYEGSVQIDEAYGPDRPGKIKVKITIHDDNATVDFNGTDPQSEICVNSAIANTYTDVYIAFLTSLDPTIPHNEGCYIPIKVIAPKGTLVNPDHPAPTTAGNLLGGEQIIHACWDALAKAIPNNVSAPWYSSHKVVLVGVNPKNGERYICQTKKYDGGAGAIAGRDGYPANAGNSICLGAATQPNIEIYESKYPIFYLKHEYKTDSGGPGKWRGGIGLDFSFKTYPPHPCTLVVMGGGSKTPAQGILGAKNGIVNKAWQIKKDGTKIKLSSGIYLMDPEDVYVSERQGGGGVGNPFERAIESVKEDALNEFVSIKSALKDYNVIVDPKTFSAKRP